MRLRRPLVLWHILGPNMKMDRLMWALSNLTKLAPLSKPTIPRLELCAAALAVEMAELIPDELDLKSDITKFYCDSKVVLGYIYNETKHFYVYVHNRVQCIHQSTKPEQWSYIPTDDIPADHMSRSVPASHLVHKTWLTGPAFLRRPLDDPAAEKTFELVSPGKDVEIRPQVSSLITKVQEENLIPKCFQHFSNLRSLIRALTFLIHNARSHKHSDQPNGCPDVSSQRCHY